MREGEKPSGHERQRKRQEASNRQKGEFKEVDQAKTWELNHDTIARDISVACVDEHDVESEPPSEREQERERGQRESKSQ